MSRNAPLTLVSLALLLGACSTNHHGLQAPHAPEPKTPPLAPAQPPLPSQPAVPVPPDQPSAPIREEPTPTPAPALTEILPGVWIDRTGEAIEFAGSVPIDVHGATPRVFLEVLVTAPDTREHEALVVTSVRPEDIHAALLLLGIQPGSPGSFSWIGSALGRTPPTGPALRVLVAPQPEGSTHPPAFVPISTWVSTVQGNAVDGLSVDSFVFAGSTFRTIQSQQVYAARSEGTIVGLTTFGTETIAWERILSPDASTDEPSMIARVDALPRRGTPVRVRIEVVR